MGFKTWLTHFKLEWFGDKELLEKGKTIPCKDCSTLFFSYCHYRSAGLVYDSLCNKCEKKEKQGGKQNEIL